MDAHFERHTDRARTAIVQAQDEARQFGHEYIGTEHILLGLMRVDGGIAAMALELSDISIDAVRQQVEEIVGSSGQSPSGHLPFTPRAKKVFELAFRESVGLGHRYIGTEHILLGLVREDEGVSTQILMVLEADLSRIRQKVLELMASDELRDLAVERIQARLAKMSAYKLRVRISLPGIEHFGAIDAFNMMSRVLGNTNPVEVFGILSRFLTKLRDSDGAEVEEVFTREEHEILLAWRKNLQSAYTLPIGNPLAKVLAAVENAERVPDEEESTEPPVPPQSPDA